MRWLLLFLLASSLGWAASPTVTADSDLVYVFILSRHGVRSPLVPNDQLAVYAASAWPQWEVAPGLLTPHGQRQMELMGGYYRARYVAAGLLSGEASADAAQIFFRADNDQRTIVSAEALGVGLTPGIPAQVRALPAGQKDPLFSALGAGVGRSDPALRKAALFGQVGGKPEFLLEENRPAFETLERILLGNAAPAGKTLLLDLPAVFSPEKGSMRQAMTLAEALLLEYADGKSFADVGWGRLQKRDILPLAAVVSLGFFPQRTAYVAQTTTSNLASHLLATLAQAAQGQPVEGALGHPGDRMAVLVGHDDNLVSLSRLLDAHWRVAQGVTDLPLPGGALIFELRRNRADGHFVVRTQYVSQSYDQMRDNRALTLKRPPSISPMFVPGCSSAEAGYDAPLDRFTAHLRAMIDPEMTAAEPAGVQ